MEKFTFQCPQCRQALQCAEQDRSSRITCPSCRTEFVPADVQMKQCPHCGKMILPAALKCQYCGEFVDKTAYKAAHATGKPANWWRNLVGIILLAVIVGCAWISWRKYRAYQKNLAARAALEEQARLERERAAQLEYERKKQLERERLANEARLREEAETARKKKQAEEKARRDAEEKARRDAEDAQRREQEAQRRAEAEKLRRETEEKERVAFNAAIDRKIAALMPKLRTAKVRLQFKQSELERAQKREEQSRLILERKGRHSEYRNGRTYHDNTEKAFNAAKTQREDVEREYQVLESEVRNLEAQIGELEAQKKQQRDFSE